MAYNYNLAFKHTPGPWVLGHSAMPVSSLSIHSMGMSVPHTLARLTQRYDLTQSVKLANARLLAAAPELLDLLHCMCELFEVHDDRLEWEKTNLVRKMAQDLFLEIQRS